MGTAFESIKQGLTKAIAHARDEEEVARRVYEPKPIDVAMLRKRISMTQE